MRRDKGCLSRKTFSSACSLSQLQMKPNTRSSKIKSTSFFFNYEDLKNISNYNRIETLIDILNILFFSRETALSIFFLLKAKNKALIKKVFPFFLIFVWKRFYRFYEFSISFPKNVHPERDGKSRKIDKQAHFSLLARGTIFFAYKHKVRRGRWNRYIFSLYFTSIFKLLKNLFIEFFLKEAKSRQKPSFVTFVMQV